LGAKHPKKRNWLAKGKIKKILSLRFAQLHPALRGRTPLNKGAQQPLTFLLNQKISFSFLATNQIASLNSWHLHHLPIISW
jgi:hypothetical protein